MTYEELEIGDEVMCDGKNAIVRGFHEGKEQCVIEETDISNTGGLWHLGNCRDYWHTKQGQNIFSFARKKNWEHYYFATISRLTKVEKPKTLEERPKLGTVVNCFSDGILVRGIIVGYSIIDGKSYYFTMKVTHASRMPTKTTSVSYNRNEKGLLRNSEEMSLQRLGILMDFRLNEIVQNSAVLPTIEELQSKCVPVPSQSPNQGLLIDFKDDEKYFKGIMAQIEDQRVGRTDRTQAEKLLQYATAYGMKGLHPRIMSEEDTKTWAAKYLGLMRKPTSTPQKTQSNEKDFFPETFKLNFKPSKNRIK